MPPRQSTPRRIASSSRSSSPSRAKMPSWGNAVTWIVQRSASSSRTRRSPRTIASFSPETSACARMKSVPCAADQRTTSEARSKTSCSVSDGFSSPQTWIPSISVPLSLNRGRPTVSDASRCTWQSTSGGVTRRPATSIVRRGSPRETNRPPSTYRSTSDPSIMCAFVSARSIIGASVNRNPAIRFAKRTRSQPSRPELPLHADVRAHRLQPTRAQRGEELLADAEALVVARHDLRAAGAALGEHRRLVHARHAPLADPPVAPHHHRRDGERRRAERQLLERVVQRGEDERLEVEQHEVCTAAGPERAETLRIARGGRGAGRRELPGVG